MEHEVLSRYAAGAEAVEPALCCPIEGYDARYLEILPREIVDKDYGCGDPSRWAREGDTVVDLGSGAGKICYILSQKVGPTGQVIGVDFNNAMLKLARKYQDEMAEKIGYANTRFVKGRIQDLALDLDALNAWLANRPVSSVEDLAALDAERDRIRCKAPLIRSDSVDLVVSNCVLNLVRPQDKVQLFDEIFRVLRRGGRAVISDIVCDEAPTERVRNDPKLWSGCIAGAFGEDELLEMFERAGFHGIEILARTEQPWQVIDGVEFRSLTVRAYKGKQGPCLERNQAAIYKGPWKQVVDDDGHVYLRGKRMAVCDKTHRLLTDPQGPYAKDMIGVEPHHDVTLDEAVEMDCRRNVIRHPRETKGLEYHETNYEPDKPCCGDNGDDNACC
ncbi:MAG: methyltransferase domain-containing protein [Phycisphaera sp.]|nr:methyltransferase domain-containing protein [Phycisphaera sp.]